MARALLSGRASHQPLWSLKLILRLLLLCAISLPLAVSCTGNSHCEENYQGAPQPEPAPQRNPLTGQCESFGGWGGGGGGSTCGDYEADPLEDRAPVPDWGICDGYCESLSEADCLVAEECRGSYGIDCPQDALCEPEFNQCWAITPTGTFSEEGCNTYQADECARHNECIAVHDWDGLTMGFFSYCTDEPSGNVDPGSCVGEVACDALPPECPTNTVPGRTDVCWSGFCIPIAQCDVVPSCDGQSEAACVNRDDCQALYEGIGCACTGESCICQEWIYQTCQAEPAPQSLQR